MDRVREDGVVDTEPGRVTCPDPGDQGACPIRTADILFDVAVNRGNGNLYAVWQDARPSDLRYDTILFTQSLNGGQTWSNPVRVNLGSDAGARVDDRQAFTSLHVADDGTGSPSMLHFAQHSDKPTLRLLVLHDDDKREFAYTTGADQALDQAAHDRWTVVSVKDDWATVF